MERRQRALLIFIATTTIILMQPAAAQADLCPDDPDKTAPGACGCGVSDADSDGDGFADCVDSCAGDPLKVFQGICGCGIPDIDNDKDGLYMCLDDCESDPEKITAGVCGCGKPDADDNGNGVVDCLVNDELRQELSSLSGAVKTLRKVGPNTSSSQKRALRNRAKNAGFILSSIIDFGLKHEAAISLTGTDNSLASLLEGIRRSVNRALKIEDANLNKKRAAARKQINKVKALIGE